LTYKQNRILHESDRQERRRFDRHQSTGDLIGIKPLGQTPGLEIKLGGVLVNISDGGLCFTQNIEWSGEQVLRLVLPIPDWRTTISTLGEVRWAKRTALTEEKYMIGIQYLF